MRGWVHSLVLKVKTHQGERKQVKPALAIGKQIQITLST